MFSNSQQPPVAAHLLCGNQRRLPGGGGHLLCSHPLSFAPSLPPTLLLLSASELPHQGRLLLAWFFLLAGKSLLYQPAAGPGQGSWRPVSPRTMRRPRASGRQESLTRLFRRQLGSSLKARVLRRGKLAAAAGVCDTSRGIWASHRGQEAAAGQAVGEPPSRCPFSSGRRQSQVYGPEAFVTRRLNTCLVRGKPDFPPHWFPGTGPGPGPCLPSHVLPREQARCPLGAASQLSGAPASPGCRGLMAGWWTDKAQPSWPLCHVDLGHQFQYSRIFQNRMVTMCPPQGG